MPRFLQPTLSGGELTPGLRGRVDLARYATSVAVCRNVITKPTGGAAKRSGTIYCGRTKFDDQYTRLIPFVYSTQASYLIEAGIGYFRFWVNGGLLTETRKTVQAVSQALPAVVTVTAHGYQTGNFVQFLGLQGLTRVNSRTYGITVLNANQFSLNGFDSSLDPPHVAGTGTVAKVTEVVTPYNATTLPNVKFTQSADVLFLSHPNVPTYELRRLTPTSFEMRPFVFRRGPFRQFNADESFIMAVSGTQGSVIVTTNKDLFQTFMAGSLVYIEEKELRGIKPWASGEKNVPLNALRRSDQKVYRAVSVPTVVGPAYYISGGTRPTHNSGRAFDGPQDVKSDGVNNYTVGVEWEFVHNTFGIVQLTSVINARTATALVIERVPDSLIGTAPAPAAGPFNFVGDGVTTIFNPLTGISSTNPVDFKVTLSGTPTQSNPSYPGGGGVSGGGGGNPRPNNNEFGPVQLE